MDKEQYLRILIGDLVCQNAILLAKVEALQAKQAPVPARSGDDDAA